MNCDVGKVTESLENEQTAHSPTFPSLHLHHNSFSNPSIALPTSQLILQPFFRFSYVRGFHLRHLASRPWGFPIIAWNINALGWTYSRYFDVLIWRPCSKSQCYFLLKKVQCVWMMFWCDELSQWSRYRNIISTCHDMAHSRTRYCATETHCVGVTSWLKHSSCTTSNFRMLTAKIKHIKISTQVPSISRISC